MDSQAERYPFLHAAEGEFHRCLGHSSEAEISFHRALEFARTEPHRRFLLRELAALRCSANLQVGILAQPDARLKAGAT